MESKGILTERYEDQKRSAWPTAGRHILAHYDDTTIVVYQAFCPEIADYAVANGRFGGPRYSFSRMTWIKTNFLWMMYRSGWATKKNQDRILAIFIKREGFEEILRCAREGSAPPGTNDHGEGPDEVRLQWDPDHHPSGAKLERRAIQLGLRGQILATFNRDWLVRVEDVTAFVQEQYAVLTSGHIDRLVTPRERTYVPSDVTLCRHIRLDGFGSDAAVVEADVTPGRLSNAVEGACSDRLQQTHLSKPNPTAGSQTERVVLCLGGSFNPVHTRHVQVMVETKQWLEENTNLRVTAGVLAVAPDGYVRSKCRRTGEKCIKAQHRIKLCELACSDIPWLGPGRDQAGSARQGGDQYRRRAGLGSQRLVIVVGADRAINAAGKAKWHSDNKGDVTVCVGRAGDTARVREAFTSDQQLGRVASSFYILPHELDNVSSTEVRKRLSAHGDSGDREDRLDTVNELAKLGWIHPDVGRYIVDHETDLYIS